MLRYTMGVDAFGGMAAEGSVGYDIGALPGLAEHGCARGGPEGPIDGLTQALEGVAAINRYLTQLAGTDLDDRGVLPDDASTVRSVLVGLGHVDAAVTAARVRAIVAAEEADLAGRDGASGTIGWVADQLRLTGGDAARECRFAARVTTMAEVMLELERGTISRDHAVQLVAAQVRQQADHDASERSRAAEAERQRLERQRADAAAAAALAVEQRQAAERAAAERERQIAEREDAGRAARRAEAAAAQQRRRAELLARSRAGAAPDEVRRRAEDLRAVDPEALARDEAAQQSRRSVRDWRDRETGMGRIDAWLPGEDYEAYLAAKSATRTVDPPEVAVAERRTREQRDADAFTDIIHAALRAGELPTTGGVKPHLTAHAPVDTVAGGDRPGRARFGTVLSAEAVRRICCDAGLVRAITNATSMVLDVGRETRQWSPAQRRAIELRDQGCRFPTADGHNCGRPPGFGDIHHVVWYRHGGRTDVDNGVVLCRRHHRAVHHEDWDMTFDPHSGQVTVTKTINGHHVSRSSPCRLPT